MFNSPVVVVDANGKLEFGGWQNIRANDELKNLSKLFPSASSPAGGRTPQSVLEIKNQSRSVITTSGA